MHYQFYPFCLKKGIFGRKRGSNYKLEREYWDLRDILRLQINTHTRRRKIKIKSLFVEVGEKEKK